MSEWGMAEVMCRSDRLDHREIRNPRRSFVSGKVFLQLERNSTGNLGNLDRVSKAISVEIAVS